MDSPKLENKNSLERGEKLQPDSDEVNKAMGVLRFFDATFSSIKLYPPDNPVVKKSVDSFYERIKEFLDEYEELIVRIGEFSFSYKGEIVFQDEEKKSSLPFFFFKDGMREISFHEGLDKKELRDFLEVIKEESELPLEDSDIVNSLWAKDFAHIRYFAIDEFREKEIGTISFEPGLDEDELAQFVFLFANSKAKEENPFEDFEAKIKEEGISHILLEKIHPFELAALKRQEEIKKSA